MRILQLKAIKEKWTAQLGQLQPSSEHRLHLIEALQDLDTVIRRLEERAAQGDESHIADTMPVAVRVVM